MRQSLQVPLEDSEIEEIREIARRRHMSVDEWIQRTLQEARRSQSRHSVEDKLRAVRAAVKHELPTGDIEQMLREIEQGYRFDPPA
jgi:hypothetical protein